MASTPQPPADEPTLVQDLAEVHRRHDASTPRSQQKSCVRLYLKRYCLDHFKEWGWLRYMVVVTVITYQDTRDYGHRITT